MSYMADAHRDWHTQHGWGYCPLDCYEVEARREAAWLAGLTDEELADYYGEPEPAPATVPAAPMYDPWSGQELPQGWEPPF